MTKILLTYLLFLAFNTCAHGCSVDYFQIEDNVQLIEQHTEEPSGSCSSFCNCLCCYTIISDSNISTEQILYNLFGFQHTLSEDLTPYSLKPTAPPPKA